jgi:hypothetical protein
MEMVTMENDIFEVLAAMEKFGGSFVRTLASLYRLADGQNQARLRHAFDEYFTKYDAMSTAIKERKNG